MLRNELIGAVAIGAVVLAAAGGCLLRKETITIKPDGAVTIALAYEGESKEFETADALPSEESGWAVTRTTKTEENGKETSTRSAERTFAAGEELPGSFAKKRDPDADLYLAFPTTIRREKRADGVYLHFRRVYTPRPWAHVQFWQDQFFDDSVKKIGEKSPDEMTHDERVQLVKAFAGFEIFKQVELVRQALRECDADLKQDAWLHARAALLKVGEDTDWGAFVDRVANLGAEERDKTFEEESKRIVQDSLDAFRRTLRTAADYGDGPMERFEAAFAKAKKRYEITSQTGGHGFEIRVHMPGEVVAHNADKIDDDGAAEWEFDGSIFRDRAYELMITSKLPKDREEG